MILKIKEKTREWHKWFAWFPIRIWDETTKEVHWVWLEQIERQWVDYPGNDYGTIWAYRIPQNSHAKASRSLQESRN